MKILIIGGSGTIGRVVSRYFSKKHNVITAGRKSGEEVVDLASSESIETLLGHRFSPLPKPQQEFQSNPKSCEED